jgi:hypothetical protein
MTGYKKPETITLTRREYYNKMRHTIRKKWEQERSVIPHIQAANQALSVSKSTQLPLYLNALSVNFDVLEQEYLKNKDRSLWKMRLFRWKKQCLDHAVQQIFDKTKNRDVVIGIGDAKFASTGRGEKAMPTTKITLAFKKAAWRYKNKVIFKSIHEFRTTMCCSSCCQVTTSPMTSTDVKSRRLRLCTNCNNSGDRVRDRDVQAARNMLWKTINWFNDHPENSLPYMCREPRT